MADSALLEDTAASSLIIFRDHQVVRTKLAGARHESGGGFACALI